MQIWSGVAATNAAVEDSSQQQKWSCDACTFLNWPRSLKCTQCQSQKPKQPLPRYLHMYY